MPPLQQPPAPADTCLRGHKLGRSSRASCCSLGKFSFPQPASRNKQHTRDPQHQPEAITSLAGARGAGQGGRAEGWIRLCRAQTPLPLPLFELLVAVLAAEAPAFPGPVPHVSAAAGIAVAQPFCHRQRGLLRHVCSERRGSEAQGRTADIGDICLPRADTRQHLPDGATHPISATTVPLP